MKFVDTLTIRDIVIIKAIKNGFALLKSARLFFLRVESPAYINPELTLWVNKT